MLIPLDPEPPRHITHAELNERIVELIDAVNRIAYALEAAGVPIEVEDGE